jgi:hypothetical protein
MYKEFDRVLKKNTQFGVRAGFVLRAWTSGDIDYVRVRWDDINTRSICMASKLLPDTAENRAALEERRAQLDAKYDQKISQNA